MKDPEDELSAVGVKDGVKVMLIGKKVGLLMQLFVTFNQLLVQVAEFFSPKAVNVHS